MELAKRKFYTIIYRPYPNWGIWTIERWFSPEELERFKKEKEVIKITKHNAKTLQKLGIKDEN